MKKLYFFIFLILLSGIVVAQSAHIPQSKNSNPYQQDSYYYVICNTTTPYIILSTDDANAVKGYLLNSIVELKTPGAGITLAYFKESLAGKHFTYQQTFDGIPVYGATVKINLDKQHRVMNVMNACLSLSKVNASQIQSQISVLAQSEFINNFMIANYSSDVEHSNEINICFLNADNAEAVQQIKVWNASSGLNEINLVSATGQRVFQKDLNTYFKPVVQDSIINIKIFRPDPLTTAHVSYGAPYKDYNDADSSVLNAQRIDTSVLATYDNDTFRLINAYAKVVDFEAPFIPAVFQINPDFFYTRSQSGFEDVNTFFHITSMQEYVQSLGFLNLMNKQIHIDSHGLGGQDNSYFSGNGVNPKIAFGEGGVDDAEDADVIIHEYGHGLSWDANGNNFISNDRGALDEGFGDYQAATYSRNIDTYHWFQVFTWDGFNEFWPGRPANGTKHYPQDLDGEVHDDGEIWCAVMMEIWGVIGKTTTDKIMYESLFGWSNNMTMPDAALLVIQADSLLNGGANYYNLCDRFSARGLYSGNCASGINDISAIPNSIEFLNTNGFADGTGNLTIHFEAIEKNATIKISDVAGRELTSLNYENTQRIEISPRSLTEGVYVVSIKTAGKQATQKVVRLN